MTKYGRGPVSGYLYMPMPSNMHTHFRHPSDSRFHTAVKEAAMLYQHVTAMPNLVEFRIRRPDQAIEYREKIEEYGQLHNSHFRVTVPLYLEPDTCPETVRIGHVEGAWLAAKLYPKGGTTASDEGVDFRNLRELYRVFAVMEELGMILLVHAEPLFDAEGEEIDPFYRESAARKYLTDIIRTFPKLKIVFEHISSAEGAQFVRWKRSEGALIEATIAPQYLTWTRAKLFRGGMNPAWYSIPVLKGKEDQRALIDFMLDGYGFLGTDSAPHLLPAKSKPCGCAGGVFNEPVGLYVYFDIFKSEGERRSITDWFDRFVAFACHKGPAFYGIKREDVPMVLLEDPWEVPSLYGEIGSGMMIPMLAGETIQYRLSASILKK